MGDHAAGAFFKQLSFPPHLQYNFNVTNPALLTQRRRQRRQKTNPGLIGGLGLGGLLSVAAALLFFAAGAGYAWLVSGLPSPEAIPALLKNSAGGLREATKISDRSGQILLHTLEHPGAAGRQYLTAEPGSSNSIPLPLVEATLAAVQPDFWTSQGYQYPLGSGEDSPTLAEMLVGDLLLGDESPGLRRSMRQSLLAGQLIGTYGQSTVLEWFLNSRSYGRLVYGADGAARAYFGIPAAEMSFAQAAWLTALAEMPGIDPYNPPARLQERQQAILEAMGSQGRLSDAQVKQARTEMITLQAPAEESGLAAELVNLAVQQAGAALGSERVARGGFRILTTLDASLQEQVTCATSVQIARLENRPDAGPADCPAGRLLPSLALDRPAVPGTVQGAAVILDTRSGQILAMSGNSLRAHETGTLLTPFVYLTAFSRGFTPASLFWDIPGAGDGGGRTYHGPLLLRTALANNYTGPAEQLVKQLGSQSILQIATAFGLPTQAATFSTNPAGGQEQAVLSGGPVTLVEAAQAFNTLANNGLAVGQKIAETGMVTTVENSDTLRPTAVLMVFDSAEQKVLDWSLPATRPVASSALAYLINHILSDEAARWPSLGHPNPLEIGRQAAAHIGYTADQSTGWTVGYTPYLTQAIWLGGDETGADGTANKLEALPEAAAGIWHALMQYASQDLPAETWPVPAGVTSRTVCAASGMLPTTTCPAVVSEFFLTGSEPIQPDNLYRSFQINRDNGLLATVFTPLELIEEHTFMVVPAEAEEWARQAGLPLPPDSYDIIYNQNANPNAQLSSPGIFDHVRGEIELRGTAAGSEFKYYRLLIGRGLNPQSWTQLGSDVSKSVKNGILGEWDTSQLEGLYAVQLMVVGANQKLESAVTQVTIDNEAPLVSLRVDQQAGQSRQVILHAEASDNLELERIEFYVDGQLVGSLTRAPFSLYWEGKTGTHTLRATAYDLAGNTASAEVSLTVK